MHSLWLMPEADAAARFRDVIADLARQFHTPVFEPHMTLVSDFSTPLDQLQFHCEQAMTAAGTVTVRALGVEGTDAPFMSVYLKLRVPKEITALRQRLIKAMRISSKNAFVPHISLAYFVDEGPFKREQIQRLDQDLEGLRFNMAALDIVRSAKVIPIAEWASAATFPFSD